MQGRERKRFDQDNNRDGEEIAAASYILAAADQHCCRHGCVPTVFSRMVALILQPFFAGNVRLAIVQNAIGHVIELKRELIFRFRSRRVVMLGFAFGRIDLHLFHLEIRAFRERPTLTQPAVSCACK
jgi:hypothetical protein